MLASSVGTLSHSSHWVSPSILLSSCSVAKSCPTLCYPINCSMPGFPVLHNLPSLFKFMSIESVMPSNHLILCHFLLLPPSIFPSIRVFIYKPVLCITRPKFWRFSFSISPSNAYSGLISFRTDLCSLYLPLFLFI